MGALYFFGCSGCSFVLLLPYITGVGFIYRSDAMGPDFLDSFMAHYLITVAFRAITLGWSMSLVTTIPTTVRVLFAM